MAHANLVPSKGREAGGDIIKKVEIKQKSPLLTVSSYINPTKMLDSKSILATTYGMVNLTDKLQVGTEVTLHNAEKVFGADDINRFGITVNPSYKITKNLRMTAEAAFTTETYKNSGADLDNATTSLTLAPVITMNNDFYGRPQIKPFITFVNVDDKGSSKWHRYDGKDSGTFAGVVAEVWF